MGKDKDRIPNIMSDLWDLWNEHSELRFMQMLGNCFRDDPYYIEDDKLIEVLNSFYKVRKQKRATLRHTPGIDR